MASGHGGERMWGAEPPLQVGRCRQVRKVLVDFMQRTERVLLRMQCRCAEGDARSALELHKRVSLRFNIKKVNTYSSN
jgi:hypothetical protein